MSSREVGPMQEKKNAIHVVAAESRQPDAQRRESHLAVTTMSVPFQLIADFAVEAPESAEFFSDPETSTEEYRFFMTLLTTPEALNRICRLALACDLNMDGSKYFDGTFMGPEPEDILNAIQSYLSPDQREYWTRLRDEKYDEFGGRILSIFEQFESSLKRVKVLDTNTGETIPLRVSSRLP